NPVSFTFDSNGNPVVAAGTGGLPNRGVKLSTFTTGIGTGSDTVGCNVAALQVVGLGASDGYAYLPSYQNGACQFVSAGILPGQTVAMSQLVAGPGWGTTTRGGSAHTNYFLQVVGLGAANGYAYLAAYQDDTGHWHSGGILPGQTIAFSKLSLAVGNLGRLQVIGQAQAGGSLYIAAWQDTGGVWHTPGPLPGQTPLVSSTDLIYSNPNDANEINVIGLGATNGYLYVTNWQDTGGTWHAAGILPNQTRQFSQI